MPPYGPTQRAKPQAANCRSSLVVGRSRQAKAGQAKPHVGSTLQVNHLATDKDPVAESNSARQQNFRTSASMCTQVCPDYAVILFPLIRIGICAIPALTGTRPTSQSI